MSLRSDAFFESEQGKALNLTQDEKQLITLSDYDERDVFSKFLGWCIGWELGNKIPNKQHWSWDERNNPRTTESTEPTAH